MGEKFQLKGGIYEVKFGYQLLRIHMRVMKFYWYIRSKVRVSVQNGWIYDSDVGYTGVICNASMMFY
jgi:hypothetical protein